MYICLPDDLFMSTLHRLSVIAYKFHIEKSFNQSCLMHFRHTKQLPDSDQRD